MHKAVKLRNICVCSSCLCRWPCLAIQQEILRRALDDASVSNRAVQAD